MSKKFLYFLSKYGKSKSVDKEEKNGTKCKLHRSKSADTKSSEPVRSFEKRRSTWKAAFYQRSSLQKSVRLNLVISFVIIC